MIGYLMVGTNDLAGSLAFYDAVFEPLGYRQTDDSGRYVGYGLPEKPEESLFYVTGPYDRQPATAGNGTMIAFPTPTLETLHEVYQIALKSGGTDEGAPDQGWTTAQRTMPTCATRQATSSRSTATTSRAKDFCTRNALPARFVCTCFQALTVRAAPTPFGCACAPVYRQGVAPHPGGSTGKRRGRRHSPDAH